MTLIHYIKVIIRTLHILFIHKFKHIQIQHGLYNINLSAKVYGKNGGLVILGKKITSSRNLVLAAVGGQINIDDNCTFSGNCTVVAHEKISIGRCCMFGPGVKIYDHDHLFSESGFLSDEFKTGAITIGDKSWIGANAIILRNTVIGEGCVIGAGTVVKGVIPPHSIVTNNRELIVKPIRK